MHTPAQLATKHTRRMLLLLLAICVCGVLLMLWFRTRDQILYDEQDVFAALNEEPERLLDPGSGKIDPLIRGPEGVVFANGQRLVATSVSVKWPGEYPLAALLDGDLHTRWASAPTEPQRLTLDLAHEQAIGKLRLYWEHATAGSLVASVSRDGRHWHVVNKRTDSRAGPWTEEVAINRSARYLRLELTERHQSAWGFSMYELQIIPLGGDEPLPPSSASMIGAVLPSSWTPVIPGRSRRPGSLAEQHPPRSGTPARPTTAAPPTSATPAVRAAVPTSARPPTTHPASPALPAAVPETR